MIECDVLVIGGGIAGSSAARSAALNDAKTIMIEEKPNSVKSSCAEAISSYLLPLLPLDIPKDQLIWNIDGIKLYADEFVITKRDVNWKGFSIEREKFNPWLTAKAIEAGATANFNTKLVDLVFDREDVVKKAVVEKNGRKIEIKPKVIIAADGAKSMVSQLLGVRKEKKYSLAYIKSFEVLDIKLEDPHFEQIFFGDFAPNGFAYIFPKSNNRANIGVGSVGRKTSDVEKFFDSFLEFNVVKKQLKDITMSIERSGYAPVDYLLEKTVYGNTIFVGDIANHNIKPFIEGIIPSIICGDIAGKCASDFIKYEIDLSKQYTELIKRKLGRIIKLSDNLLKIMIKIFEQNSRKEPLLLLALSADLFELSEYFRLFNLSYTELRKKIEETIRHKN